MACAHSSVFTRSFITRRQCIYNNRRNALPAVECVQHLFTAPFPSSFALRSLPPFNIEAAIHTPHLDRVIVSSATALTLQYLLIPHLHTPSFLGCLRIPFPLSDTILGQHGESSVQFTVVDCAVRRLAYRWALCIAVHLLDAVPSLLQ